MTGANGTDTLGPWFDGVKHLSQKEPDIVDVNAAKRKTIAIVGTGMSDYVDPDSGKRYNVSDTGLVFSLIGEMSKTSHNNSKVRIDTIPWHDKNVNGL
ncbi:hypothetical protein J3458_014462 [Metarhizium acridum]|uniref:uncharacterized protein n=1 Tax=Metarhizium acridum TaxID=92637 RepID=UPI001C6C998E|nr:hypothetical protein J3458_014462 [Metarhizium acridum]